MSNYQAPLRDMRFVIHELVESGPICALPGYADCDAGLIDAVLEEAFDHLFSIFRANHFRGLN